MSKHELFAAKVALNSLKAAGRDMGNFHEYAISPYLDKEFWKHHDKCRIYVEAAIIVLEDEIREAENETP